VPVLLANTGGTRAWGCHCSVLALPWSRPVTLATRFLEYRIEDCCVHAVLALAKACPVVSDENRVLHTLNVHNDRLPPQHLELGFFASSSVV
jgi:hypothetical protein